MSIADRAAEVIEKVARESETPALTGVYAVSALRQENLLAPDLPKPDRIKHKAIFKYRASDEYNHSMMATPVEVTATSQREALEKVQSIWGHIPKYLTLLSIKEQA